MARPDLTDRETDPASGGRLGRWLEHGRTVQARVEGARPQHATVDFGLTLLERDSTIGGGLLAGALAYRLFVLLLPTALLVVSGLGLYAGPPTRARARWPVRRGCTGSSLHR